MTPNPTTATAATNAADEGGQTAATVGPDGVIDLTDVTTDEALRPGTHYRTELFSRIDLVPDDGLVVDVGGRDGRLLGALGIGNGLVVDTEVAAREGGVAYVGGSGLDLPLVTGCADTVISLDVVEHVPDDAAFVAELMRVVKPGGRVVLTTPNVNIRVLPGRLQNRIDRMWGHDRVRGYSPATLRELFTAAGATEVEITPVAMGWYRRLYVPLRLLWSVPGGLGRRLVSLIARRDAAAFEGEHGFCLVVARREA
ncbi:MAG: methyltransferase domain-containing protein [Actinomycetota bacterium]